MLEFARQRLPLINYPCTAPAPAPPLPLPLHRPAVAGSMSGSGSAPHYASVFGRADARLNLLYKRSLECRSICVELQAKVARLELQAKVVRLVVVQLLKKQQKQTEKKKDKKHAKKARKLNTKKAGRDEVGGGCRSVGRLAEVASVRSGGCRQSAAWGASRR